MEEFLRLATIAMEKNNPVKPEVLHPLGTGFSSVENHIPSQNGWVKQQNFRVFGVFGKQNKVSDDYLSDHPCRKKPWDS